MIFCKIVIKILKFSVTLKQKIENSQCFYAGNIVKKMALLGTKLKIISIKDAKNYLWIDNIWFVKICKFKNIGLRWLAFSE